MIPSGLLSEDANKKKCVQREKETIVVVVVIIFIIVLSYAVKDVLRKCCIVIKV
jgi:hypothetical protein